MDIKNIACLGGDFLEKKKKEKRKMTTDIKVFIVVCVIVTLIIGAAIVYIVRPKNVAIVGDNVITGEEFTYYFSQNVQNTMMQYNYQNQDVNSFLNTSLGDSTIGDMIKQQTLTQVVQIEVLLQEAKKEGFKPDQAKMDEAWGYMEQSINSGAEAYGMSANEFCKEAFGTSLNKAKQFDNNLYTVRMYMDEKIKAIPVDDAELAAYYEENKVNFDYNVVSHILVKCEKDAEEAVIKEKEKAAQDILDKVNAGEDFASLAKEFSEDTGSKDTGGIIQVQQNGMMVPEFEEWAFSNKLDATGIVRTDFGFHIMKMNEINDSLEAQKENITFTFQSEKYQKIVEEKLNGEEYKVEIQEGYNEL